MAVACYIQEFAGNEDRYEERQQFLKSPFIARYVRIHPTNWHRHIGLRAGLLGCPYVGKCLCVIAPVNCYQLNFLVTDNRKFSFSATFTEKTKKLYVVQQLTKLAISMQ